MKSKAESTRARDIKQNVPEKAGKRLVAAVAGGATQASAQASTWRSQPFTLNREWLGYAGRNAVLIAWTFVASLLLASILPNIFAKAFQMPQAAFTGNPVFVGTFIVFALIRAGLSLRIVDHAVRVPSVGKWVGYSVLSDIVFQIVLSLLVPLMPLPFSKMTELVWQFACAGLGGLVTGWLQWRMFQPQTKPQLVWVIGAALAWTVTFAVLALLLYLRTGTLA
jgi:hypothetical protein